MDEKGFKPQEQRVEQKKPYETPTLTEYGRIVELTRGSGTPTGLDVASISI